MRTSWGQSLAVCMVVLCGVACQVCMSTAYLSLQFTRDSYCAKYRLSDFEIMAERIPLAQVFKLQEIPGVRAVYGRIVRDVNVDIEGVDEPRIGRMISLPNPHRNVSNDIALMAGRYFSPGAQDEVIVNGGFAETNGLKIGDRFQISVENRKYSLRIVGLALSPEYVYIIRNVQELLPSPERFGILWTPREFAETAMQMSAACNNIVGHVDNPEELETILERAGALLEPYGVFAKVQQKDRVSTAFLNDELAGLRVSIKVIPALFMGIAALILLVLLNRMVRNERTQIGLLKAYGYSRGSVGFHYIEYAMILALLGATGGVLTGLWLGAWMLRIYGQFYQFPALLFRVYPGLIAQSAGAALGFSILGALFAAIRAMQIHPAESMRPEAPRTAHTVWLERWTALWRRMSFIWKMIARNVPRSPFRSSLNVFGAAISTALLMMGFYGMDAMNHAMRIQFEEAQREDAKVSFQFEHGKDTFYDIRNFPHVRYAEPLMEYPFEMRSDWRKRDVVVVGLPEHAQLQKIIDFGGREEEAGPNGLVLSDRLAEALGVEPGDRVSLKPLMGRVNRIRTLPVRAITRQFLGLSVYTSIDTLSGILGESFAMNAALLRIEDGKDGAFKKKIKEAGGIGGVTFRKDAYRALTDTLAKHMQVSNIILLAFAGIIAFSVIYNIATVALAERQRELASLRVLGLEAGEVGRILYYENALLSLVGVAFGIPLGMLICRWLATVYDNDLYRLPFYIMPRTYIIAVVATLGFVALANLTIHRKVRSLDLVEALKSRE